MNQNKGEHVQISYEKSVFLFEFSLTSLDLDVILYFFDEDVLMVNTIKRIMNMNGAWHNFPQLVGQCPKIF